MYNNNNNNNCDLTRIFIDLSFQRALVFPLDTLRLCAHNALQF